MGDDHPDFSGRNAVSGVNEVFYKRWSPRAFLPKPIADADLEVIFDAARWSPSGFNEQPWTFYTSTEASYETFLSLLVERNQGWVKSAPVIGVIVAAKHFAKNGNENKHAGFDAGAAWMGMNLQAELLGLHAHAMGGVLYEKVYSTLGIDPKTHQVICAFALGYKDLSVEEEVTPRKALSEIWRPVG